MLLKLASAKEPDIKLACGPGLLRIAADARRLLDAGNWKAAEERCLPVLREDARCDNALNLLGCVLFATRRTEAEANLVRYARRPSVVYETRLWRGGLLLLRPVTTLRQCNGVYFCFGVYRGRWCPCTRLVSASESGHSLKCIETPGWGLRGVVRKARKWGWGAYCRYRSVTRLGIERRSIRFNYLILFGVPDGI